MRPPLRLGALAALLWGCTGQVELNAADECRRNEPECGWGCSRVYLPADYETVGCRLRCTPTDLSPGECPDGYRCGGVPHPGEEMNLAEVCIEEELFQ